METWAAAGEGGGGARGAAAGPREGTLEIAVASASNLPNTQLFGRQDPYVELRVGGRVEKSRSCNDGGTRPVWNEIFTFGTKGDKRFTLLVWNSCWLRKDKLMYAPAEGHVRARPRPASDRRTALSPPHPPHRLRQRERRGPDLGRLRARPRGPAGAAHPPGLAQIQRQRHVSPAQGPERGETTRC